MHGDRDYRCVDSCWLVEAGEILGDSEAKATEGVLRSTPKVSPLQQENQELLLQESVI